MAVDIHSKEGQLIRRLIPLSTMPVERFESVCKKISIKSAKPNTFLFKRDDTENKLIYLIQGSITLQSDSLIVDNIDSGSDSAKFALAHQIPRKIDALASTPVLFFKLDVDAIESPPRISCEQEDDSYMVIDEDEEEGSGDWMTSLLKLPIFRTLPPANLQQIIMSVQEVSFKKGELIIKQGDPGDYYYLIKKGHCLISRRPSASAKDIKLAQLRAQDSFGEDALLSGEPRNVSVTALTEVDLIRLSKEKFVSLIKEPSLKFIKHTDLADELADNTILVDVRAPDEFSKQHLPESVNIPFFSLRMYIKSLDKNKSVIIVCSNGKTSEAAAFLLLRNKISARIVEGGMENIPVDVLESSATFSIENSENPLLDNNGTVIKTDEAMSPTSLLAETVAPKNSNISLHVENTQLKQTIQALKEDKAALERKYRILFKQTERLKAILDGLKK